jgi:ferredoxin
MAGVTRRLVLAVGAALGAVAALFGGRSALAQAAKAAGPEAEPLADALGRLFQKHYQKMSPDEVKQAVGRIERRAKRQSGTDITVGTEPARDGVVFGYALNISKCKGVRKCVEACVAENNTGRDSSLQYIRVLELDHGDMNLNRADHYYEAETVPRPGKFYLPVQCMQCDNPPCVKACPVEATWQERDGITGRARGGAQPGHPLPGQPAAPPRRGREVHLLYPALAQGAPAGVRGGLPDRGPHLRQSPRPRQRHPLRAGEQDGLPPQGGPRHRTQVLVLHGLTAHA